MNTKTVLSLILSATVGLAVVGNLFAGNLLIAAGLVFAVLGVGVLAHLAFFEEKRKRKNRQCSGGIDYRRYQWNWPGNGHSVC